MSSDFRNFLNQLSDEQLENLKELFQDNKGDMNDQRTTKSEKKKETGTKRITDILGEKLKHKDEDIEDEEHTSIVTEKKRS